MSAALKQQPDGPTALKASQLTAQGLSVFPCLPDKSPACKWGELATNDPTKALQLWRIYPAPLIGVVTGHVSGFDVLDIDWAKGGDAFHTEHCTRLPPIRLAVPRIPFVWQSHMKNQRALSPSRFWISPTK